MLIVVYLRPVLRTSQPSMLSAAGGITMAGANAPGADGDGAQGAGEGGSVNNHLQPVRSRPAS